MAMTVRLSDQLRLEVGRYSEREGLTVNALITVALREYLDRRRAVGALDAPHLGSVAVDRADEAPMALAAAIAQRARGQPVRVSTPSTGGNRAQRRAVKKAKR